MSMKDLIEKIRETNDCIVLPSSGIPKVANKVYNFPSDLKEFYGLCGGMTLFASKEYAIKIVEPSEFVLANPVIIGELYPKEISFQFVSCYHLDSIIQQLKYNCQYKLCIMSVLMCKMLLNIKERCVIIYL